ncbi:hypothetical protein [Pseudodesulfovibrio piezophilus]|uniref:hypothetical protein n=1 Tax=Pseudodesulfovibrio piezophilus TaxID=879567 RepID=UPI00034D42AB|nr:hypothetical protein [Pseudodesulfovibrio piezophilus]
MKKHVCDQCLRVIDNTDFFMETEGGKMCSDCLIENGPIQADCLHLFKPFRSMSDAEMPGERHGSLGPLPMKDAS